MKRSVLAGIVALLTVLTGCKSAETPAPESATAAAAPAVELVNTTENENEPQIEQAEQVDLSKLSERAVTVYTQGSMSMTLADILPLLSSSGGYSQKWEFYIYTEPYQVRVKFEISNFAFSKNEGKVRGYVKKIENGNAVEDYRISSTLKGGQWKADKNALNLEFGDYTLSLKDNMFHIKGTFEKGTFEYDIPANYWKPGTGNVYFGNSKDNVFKYSILTYHQNVSKGVVVADGTPVDVTGQAYGNHYATTVAVYDMFDEVADFRQRTDDLLVEFRYYVPSAKYDGEPFGFMFVAAEGQPLLSSTTLERESLETWLDDQNYGYEIDARQRMTGREGKNTAVFEILSADPEPSDPYADLPAFQRNIASKFSKPIEYRIPMQWELKLDVDGYQAKIPMSSSYSVTRLR